jgi:hypothetical protein
MEKRVVRKKIASTVSTPGCAFFDTPFR